MNQDDRVDIACELRFIIFDLNALICMVEDDYPYHSILCKIGSIRKALCNLRHSLIAYQVRESIFVIQNQHNSQTQLCELSRLQDLYKEKTQTP